MADTSTSHPRVIHEADSPRRFTRVRLPARAIIDGQSHPVADWSPGGVGVMEVETTYTIGQPLSLQLVVPLSGFEVTIAADCEVVYVDVGRRRLGCRFVRLDAEQTAALRALVQAGVEGETASPDQLVSTRPAPVAVVTRPVTPASPPGPAVGRFRRVLGYAFLSALGLTLLFVAGALVHGYLFTVEAFTAAVVANTLDVRAPADGQLEGTRLAPGSRVRAGATLFSVRNEAIAAELNNAGADLRKAEVHLESLRQALAERRGFFAEYGVAADAEHRKALAEMDRARTALALARTRLQRVVDLARSGYVAAQLVDDERRAVALAEMELHRAESTVAQAASNVRMAAEGQYFTGSRLEGSEPREIERQIQLAEAAVAAARIRARGLGKQMTVSQVRTPCDCVVHLVAAYPGELVLKGQIVYTLKPADEQRLMVEALVPQEVAGALSVGAPADILLADRTVWAPGRVAALSRTGFGEKRTGMPSMPVGVSEKYAIVLLELEQALGRAPAGLPARVIIRAQRKLPFIPGWTGAAHTN